MKEIVRQYGKTLIVLVSTLLIIELFFSLRKTNNIFNRTKIKLNEMNDNKLSKENKEILYDKKNINVHVKSNIYQNKLYNANKIFYGDSNLYVKIIDIEKDNNCEKKYEIKDDGEKIIFKDEGIYRVYIHVEDEQGIQENMEIYVGVESI